VGSLSLADTPRIETTTNTDLGSPTDIMTELFDTFTIAQCRFIRSTGLSTSEQCAAFNTALYESAALDDNTTPKEASKAAVALCPSPMTPVGATTKPEIRLDSRGAG
jgi:hypothetical protein